MIDFLHGFNPNPILISLGPINIYWYGFFIVLGALVAILTAIKISSYYSIKKEVIIDLAFWLILSGLIGARLYHVFLEFPYYLRFPWDIFKVWQGGLAIHGAIVFGLVIVWMYAVRHKLGFWLLASLIAPGLAIAQVIGRWGNYFNQELFGRPTNLAWGIPISILKRPDEFIAFEYFQPTFFYESLGNFFIFLLLVLFHILIIKKRRFENSSYFFLVAFYLIAYSILRFGMELIRIDETPEIFGLRFPQIASLAVILLTFGLLAYRIRKDNKSV